MIGSLYVLTNLWFRNTWGKSWLDQNYTFHSLNYSSVFHYNYCNCVFETKEQACGWPEFYIEYPNTYYKASIKLYKENLKYKYKLNININLTILNRKHPIYLVTDQQECRLNPFLGVRGQQEHNVTTAKDLSFLKLFNFHVTVHWLTKVSTTPVSSSYKP